MDSLFPTIGALVFDRPHGTFLPAASASRRRALLVPSLLLCALGVAELRAQDRLVRTFGQEQGLTAPPVWALAQDSTGFLWIGAEGGLFRFDGTEIRRWAAETIQAPVAEITVSPSGRIVVRTSPGSAFEITPTGARTLAAMAGTGVNRGAGTIVFDRRGVLWSVQDGMVTYLTPDETWHPLPAEAFQHEQPRRLRENPGGGVDVATTEGLWRVLPDSAPRKVYSALYIRDMFSPAPDRLLILALDSGQGHVVAEISAEGTREVFLPQPLPGALSFAERHGTIWVALDRLLVALRPGEPPELLGREHGVQSGGRLLVDREGSLWMGSFIGLHQYPEPETRTWDDRHGLPSRLARFVARSGDALWVGTWAGNAYLRRSAAGWTAHTHSFEPRSRLCTDAQGTVWTAADGSLVEIRDTLVTRWPEPAIGFVAGCAAAPNGGLWVGGKGGLWHLDPVQRRLHSVASPPGMRRNADVVAALHDRHGRLWVGVNDRVCQAPAARLLAGARNAWRCQQVPGLGFLTGMVELPSGALWASSAGLGVLTGGEEGWQPLPMDDLPTRTVFALVPSPRGGVWVVGHGILQRVRDGVGGRWEVLERLAGWHGLLASTGSDLVEDPDGTLWITSDRGLSRIPPEVRFAVPPPPPVVLVEARVDDQPQPLEGPLRLPHNRNRVELRFTALSFRDPSHLRHQVRLEPDEPWSESYDRPSFRWVDLRPGWYDVEYRASLDGVHWSPEPIRFAFEVLPAWYRTPWFLVFLALLTGTLAWSIYRARVAYLIGLERQRTRIAMDLHDEVGSGLASVGILSGVLAADGLPERERRQMAGEIAAAAEELGHALSDIVWSLDPRTATLQELAARLAEHGGRLCADGEPEFSAYFPESWPAEALDMAVRRNVLLVGLEALHNAVRHAGARTVVLSLLPQAGGDWELSVRDDGAGFAAGLRGNGRPGNGHTENGRQGHGLPGMRRRADEIGAELEVRSAPGRGTTVTLRFGLRPAPPRRSVAFGARLRRLMPQRLT